MDKVKVALALLKKYHFWVMTLSVVLLGLIGWFTATGKLWADYLANKSKIDQRFDTMKKIAADPEAKNEQWIAGVATETSALKDKVAIAWKNAYLEQRNKVLRWPATLAYRAELEKFGLTGDIPFAAREEYRNYIREEFPRLLAIVDAENYGEAKAKTLSTHKQSDDTPRHDYKVIWDIKSQEVVHNQLVGDSQLTSDQVREIQENLWVYEALLNIIGGGPDTAGSLNEFASGNYNAKVKRIEELLIGTQAARLFQQGMAEGQKDMEKPEVAVAPTEGAAPPPAAAEKAVDGRYLDDKGVPIPPAQPGAPVETTEFKRMPVMMKLIMDQRELTRLLVACANSPLPIEVRQFRVSSLSKSKSAAKGGSGGQEKTEQGPFDVSVELMGIIYIFNPPDQMKLGPAAALTDAADAQANGKEAPAAAGAPAGAAANPTP